MSFLEPTGETSVLLVEDDRDLAGMLSRVLTEEGYQVTHALDGHTALHLSLTRSFDLMVLDRGLPAIEGLDLIARLRSRGVNTPTLILSALGSAQDKVAGLDAGAEDYLAKPFELSELLARLRALLRRHSDRALTLPIPGGRLLVAERAVRGDNGNYVELSERECALLTLFATRPGQVFSRSELLLRIFGESEADNLVDTYVHYCRRKIGPKVISTVRGLGYRLGQLS